MRWLLALLIACHPRVSLPPGDPIIVEQLRGRSVDGVAVFLGVPYASAARWELPTAHAPFVGVRDAQHHGPVCPQGDRGVEDCLQLNVYAPIVKAPAPVMVFLHGGAFVRGSATASYLDATSFARETGIVVVTVDYRIGVLGMMAHPAIGRGNYGIADAIEALRWVKAHAAAFGGDPANVTLAGESSGAIAACAILGAPRADGLYQRAILESGGGCSQFPTPETAGDAPSGFAVGEAVAKNLGCADAVCLRAQPVTALTHVDVPKSSLALAALGVLVDGAIVTEMPAQRIRHTGVPLLLGYNADEGSLLAPKGRDKAAFTQEVFACPTEALAAASAAPAYLYRLDRRAPIEGAFHGLELLLLFGAFPGADHLPEKDRDVAATIRDRWATFIRGGAPWQPYPQWLAIDAPAQTKDGRSSPPCTTGPAATSPRR